MESITKLCFFLLHKLVQNIICNYAFIKAGTFFIVVFTFLNYHFIRAQNIDSIKIHLSKSKDVNKKAEAYAKLIDYYSHVNLDSSLKFAEKGLNLANKLDSKCKIDLYLATANALSLRSSNDSCFSLLFMASDICNKINDTTRLIRTNAILSSLNNRKGNLVKAQECINEAIRLATLQHNSTLINKHTITLAHYFYNSRDIKKSLAILSSIENSVLNDSNDLNKQTFFLECAMVYEGAKDLDKCLLYAKKALNMTSKRSDLYNKCLCFANIYWAHIGLFEKTKNPKYCDSAYQIMDSAIIVSKLCGNLEVRLNAYNARIYSLNAEKKYKKAIEYAYSFLPEVKNTGVLYELANTYGGLSDSYKNIGQCDSVLRYYKLSEAIMDSLRGENTQSKMEAQQVKADFELKELKLKIDQERKEFETNSAILLRNSIIVAITLLSISFFLLFSYKKQKQLRTKHEEYSKQLIINQEQEKTKIAMELHDNIGQNLLLAKNHLQIMAEQLGKTQQSIDLVDRSLQDIRNLSRELHPHLLETLGLAKAIYNMTDSAASASDIYFTCEIDENINTKLNATKHIHVYRIIQECVSNVIKHSKAEAAKVTAVIEGENLILTIQDNGISMEKPPFQKLSATSFGFKSLQERTSILNGQVKAETSKGKGLMLIFTIPL